MDSVHAHRPRISRETRLLVTTAVVAVMTLWALARVRFPDQPAPSNPVAPIFTQLSARPAFDELAAEIADLQPRIERLLPRLPSTPGRALHVGANAAAVLIDPVNPVTGELREQVVALDLASGLAI